MADKNSAETATKAAKLAVNVEDKKAAAQAEVDALVRKAQKALAEFEKLDQQAVDRIVAKASVAPSTSIWCWRNWQSTRPVVDSSKTRRRRTSSPAST